MIGRGVAPGARERDEIGHGRRRLDELGLRRPATTHRDDHDLAFACEQACDMACDRGLADPLARTDHGERQRRALPARVLRWIEAEVGADVREARGQCTRGPAHPLGRPEHRLVRQIDDQGRIAEPLDERHAVIEPAAQLLAPAHEYRPGPFVRKHRQRLTNDCRRMLPVDERDRPHRFAVTSFSIRPVYFSYSSVSRSNWMIRSCPWNGYRRHTATCEPLTSTTL